MLPRLFTLLSALSLLLCMATAALWVRSYWVADGLGRYHPAIAWADAFEQHSWWLDSSQGRIHFFRGTSWYKPRDWTSEVGWRFEKSDPSRLQFIDDQSTRWFGRLGLGTGAFQFGAVTGVEAMWPHWLVCVGTTVLPAARFATKRRLRRRVTLNLCPACGYDLRATPNRCPECGKVPAHG